MTENEIFEGIHKDCGSLEICNYKETGCGDCLIRQTLIKAEEALEEIQAYRAIGTVKEFKALKEKSEPKKPRWYGHHFCPNCNSIVYVNGGKDIYCPKCGQKLDWE